MLPAIVGIVLVVPLTIFGKGSSDSASSSIVNALPRSAHFRLDMAPSPLTVAMPPHRTVWRSAAVECIGTGTGTWDGWTASCMASVGAQRSALPLNSIRGSRGADWSSILASVCSLGGCPHTSHVGTCAAY